MSEITIDPYLIDLLRKEEEKRRREEGRQGVPLHIYPPGFDGYRDDPKKSNNNQGYIEIDISGDEDEDHITIKM